MLYGDGVDMTKVMFGENARHVGAWMYVQNQGPSVVSFVGGSMAPAAARHPLRFGSERTHQFVLGELIVRPHLVIATDALRGSGLASLATSDHDFGRMLSSGEVLLGDPGAARWNAG
ncbi:hypothetical protein [Micromonospora sp. NPDC047730]|uniref:hypothetical protein n=1 Tax=Micromonospora sp. NPDC047730 TaxID=3364253 RepID=UPI0037198386